MNVGSMTKLEYMLKCTFREERRLIVLTSVVEL